MTQNRPGLFERLKSGLEQGIEFAREERPLKVTELSIPDPPPQYNAEAVRALRLRLNMSQPRFSRLVNVSTKTVQSWEQGVRRPSQSSARLLQFLSEPQLLTALIDTGTSGT